MPEGIIVKALSGFYYVKTTPDAPTIECRGRGKLRYEGTAPLVGDLVDVTVDESESSGTIERIHPRKNSFHRPAVSNIDCMVILACAVNPVSDPFLIDRMCAYAEHKGCEVAVCINKADIDPGDALYDIYKSTGYTLIRTSAQTGTGIEELRRAISGKVCAFAGNSGVGKSSLLNALSSDLNILVGEVSEKLGRGRHTTRHVELFSLGDGAYIADTPGFSSFDLDRSEFIPKQQLQYDFNEFAPFLGKCRFDDCAHISEPDCAVRLAVEKGTINESRHESYKKLYAAAAKVNEWELKKP